MADDSSLESIQIRFVSGAIPDDPVILRGVYGREQISQLFEFDLLLQREEPYTDDELDQLLKAPCAIALGPKAGDVVHGLLARIEVVDHERNVHARYLARMVPNLWLLTMTKTSRIFQDLTVPDMVKQILESYGLTGANFECRVNHDTKSPSREFIVQYEESDWDFIQRWLEHEGFFYWFEHGETEKLLIADDNGDATHIDDPQVISYRERNNVSAGRQATIWDWNLVQTRIPARVVLVDHNYRQPSVALLASEVIDAQRGFGTQFLYGNHFKDNGVGKALAQLRAERVRCARKTFRGRTDCSRFRVGHTFELENHFEGANDGKYLITRIEHRVGYPLDPKSGENLGATPQRYFARFDAIPLDVPFRPERITPWPRINGVMHAQIDADTSGDYAAIDSEGRYKVRFPYDVTAVKGAKASRWIRMAQPYAGAGYGSHHPLHKGTEVLVAHVDGDPDRPIIMGAVPNPQTLSPSTGSNATQSVTQTASGIRVEMEDLQS